MHLLVPIFLALALLASSGARAQETYDLIFKSGTLDDVAKDSAIIYERNVRVADNAEAAQAGSGLVKLTFEADDMAQLRFHQGEKHRNIGAFPATVGNPMIMYFVETVVRDMAQNAGGSPFYIRNRVKDSLIQFAEIQSENLQIDGAEVAVQQITLRPFLNDKNRDRMKGYGDLALTITMSEDVPGWYYSLVASVKGNGPNPIYENAVTFASNSK